jgi:hypothetical protein
VVDTENGHPLYTISKAPHRGFIITNQRGDVLLRANDNVKIFLSWLDCDYFPMYDYNVDQE